jgi:hypothetical protein
MSVQQSRRNFQIAKGAERRNICVPVEKDNLMTLPPDKAPATLFIRQANTGGEIASFHGPFGDCGFLLNKLYGAKPEDELWIESINYSRFTAIEIIEAVAAGSTKRVN